MSSSLLVFQHGGADFLGAILGGMVWSAYAVLFFWFITLERKARPNHRDTSRRLTYVLTALFGIATLTCGVDLGTAYLLLVPNADPTLIAAWRLATASSVLLGIVDFLSQMIIIYRCWIVWNRNYYVISPVAFLSFCSLVGQLVTAGFFGSVSGGAAEPIYYITLPLDETAFGLSMAVNTLVTGLVVGRIWIQSRQLNTLRDGQGESKPFNRVMALIIESGLMNFVMQLLYLILYSSKNSAFSLVETCTVHFYGITPTLLGIRVTTGKAIDSDTTASRSLAFASTGAGDTTVSIEAGGQRQQARGWLFELASKEATIIGTENV